MATSGTHALSLQEATRNSTAAWQRDLAALFQHAKDRFPDVVWELSNEPEEGSGNANGSGGTEEVWGHKAIVYARAPPSFQTRYFSFRPVDGLGASTMSLDIPRTSRSPSPLGRASPAPSTMGGITRLTTSINPALFSNELEYLYTGQGFGEAFEFLFDEHAGEDSTSLDGEELRIDKLRKDLVFMWRSRLYSDVRVALTMNGPAAPAGDDDDADAHERQMPVFSSHRFILASRSPYFHTALVTWPSPSPQKSLSSSLSSAPGEPLTLTLPSPPFTPASLHFTLGFLYTGTLVFSHRTYDLSTALALLLSANYLQLPTLHTEVQARIVSEMAHGLFHAALPFAAYEELTKGAWRAGGCTCRKCAMRVPRILEFSLRPDVQDAVLERGARRALVGLFGTGWCTSEFAALPAKLQASALKGLAKRTTPANALPILWAAEAALARLSPMVDPWVDVVRPLIESGRSQVDAVLGNQTAEVLGEADWTQIMHTAGVRFEDGERVEWTMRAVVRGLKETNAGRVYQALVNVLLLPHPDPPGGGAAQDEFPAQPLLSQTSHVRVQVEQARMDTLTWLKRGGRGRADRVAREGGLDGVEAWAVREIADHLELPFDDLVAAIPPAPGQHARQPTSTSAARKSTGLLSAHLKDTDQHSLSIHTQQSSMRVSVLSRSIPTPRGARSVTRNGGLAASASSSAANSADEAPDEEEEHEEENETTAEKDDIPLGDRPDSKLTPEPGIGLGLGLSDKGKGRANGNGHGNGSAPPSPTVAAMKKPPVPTRAVPVPPSPAPSSSSATSVTGSPVASRSTVSVNLTPPQPPQARPRSAASSRTGTTSTRTSTARPGSAASQRSTSTVRTTRGGLKAPPLAASNSGGSGSSGRRTSTASTTDFHTAPSTTGTRSRQSSVSSAVSRHSTATAGARSRRTSNASDVSVRTTGGASTSTNRPPVPALDPALHSPARRRGTPSIRSVASSTSTMDTAASAARKAAAAVTREKRNAAAAESKPETKVITLKQRGRGTKDAQKTPTAESSKDKEKEKALPTPSVSVSVSEAEEDEDEKGKDHRKTDSTASSASASTLRVKRKGSGDTVSTVTTKAGGVPSSNTSTSTAKATAKPKTTTAPKRPAPAAPVPVTGTLKDLPQPRGATLDIGIPCIIASKRKRFKAFARYIGEVEGESGPWVGVEVPPGAADNITFSSSSSSIGGGRQWHDGSWGGIRYFEIGPAGSGGSEAEYGYGDDSGRDRASRRRRLEGASGWSGSGGGTVKGVKREGDSSLLGGGARGAKRIRSASPAVSDADGAGEARGLFVRPSAVLYVVDAVGADI